MVFQEALRYFLNTSSLSCAQRVYWRRAPERTVTPYLEFSEMKPRPLHAHTGPSNTIQRSIQFSIFDSSQSDAAAIADALRTLLDGYRGTMGPSATAVTVGSVLWESQFYQHDADTKLHMEAVDFGFQWIE